MAEETIHLLHGGRSLCVMSTRFGVPANWPAGHKWVDIQGHDLPNVCEACRTAYEVTFGKEVRRGKPESGLGRKAKAVAALRVETQAARETFVDVAGAGHPEAGLKRLVSWMEAIESRLKLLEDSEEARELRELLGRR